MDEEPPTHRLEGPIRAALAAVRDLDPDATQRLASLAEKVRDQRFDVAVLGEFKRGKSTFVNALLGAAVLPTGVLPVTSVVTEIAYADGASLHVDLVDGAVDADPSRIAEFVTEEGNPSNGLGVRRIVLGYPATFLRGGIALYDTPGVGSVHDANTAATLELLPTVDAAFFLTSADPPISASERAFLERVADHADKLFFVVNKLDAIPESERERVLAFTAGVLGEAVGRNVDVFGASARTALEGEDPGMLRLVGAFTGFLTEGRASTTVRSVVRKASAELGRVRDMVRIEEDALGWSSDAVVERRRRIAELAEESAHERRTVGAVLHRDLEDVVTRIEDDLRAFDRAEVARLLSEARTIVESWRELRVEPAVLDARIKDLLRADVNAWLAAEQRTVSELVRAAVTRFSDAADREAQRAVAACGDVLELELDEVPTFEGLAPARTFTFSLFEPPGLLPSLAPDVRARLSRQLSARLSMKTAEARIPSLVDKHCGRLRYHLTQQLAETERALVRAFDAHLTGFIDAVEGALDRARALESENEAAVNRRVAALEVSRRRLDDATTLLADARDGRIAVEAS